MGKNRNLGFFMIEIIPKIIGFNLFRKIGFPKMLPIFLTLSVNDWCNSRCKTCNIWRNNPQKVIEEQLSVEEYGKIFENYGKVYWITITGGEPFLRNDFVKIIKTVYRQTKPDFLTIATNATLPEKIISDVKELLAYCKDMNLIVNISLDEIGPKHDSIRGLKGNFEKAVKTFNLLKKINNPRLIVGINTVVSTYNVNNFSKIYEYVKNVLKPESFIIEIAEIRSKLYNTNLAITPKYSDYKKVLEFLLSELSKARLAKYEIINNLRQEYYKFLLFKSPIKSFEGIASGYIMSNGDVWVSYTKKFIVGNLRKANYDFRKLWFNENAKKYRQAMEETYSPMLANAFYVNFICNPMEYFKLL